MSYITIQNHETLESLRYKLKKASDQGYKTRLKAIVLAKQGKKRFEIVEQLTVNPGSVTTWLQRYNQSGTAGLLSNKGGRPEGNPKWDSCLFTALAKEIDKKKGYWSIPRMQDWLYTKKQVEIPEQTVWYRMNQLQYSYKGARPHPVQGSTEQQAAFKKGSRS
jgi:transposase